MRDAAAQACRAESAAMADGALRRLQATLGFATLEPRTPELRLLHQWLDSWRGIGDVERGMARQGYDLQLTRYDERG